MKLLLVEGARTPVPDSWRRHCWCCISLDGQWVCLLIYTVSRKKSLAFLAVTRESIVGFL